MQEDFLNPGRKALDNSESDPLDPLRKTAELHIILVN
jgi:hypothetical protein